MKLMLKMVCPTCWVVKALKLSRWLWALDENSVLRNMSLSVVLVLFFMVVNALEYITVHRNLITALYCCSSCSLVASSAQSIATSEKLSIQSDEFSSVQLRTRNLLRFLLGQDDAVRSEDNSIP